MLPAFASVDDLAIRVLGGISDDDAPRAQAALDQASTKIRAEAGKTWVVDDELVLPTGDDEWRADVLFTVCLSAAFRSFTNPEQIQSESLGAYSETVANASADVYLTAQERTDVRRAAGGVGLFVLSTTRSDVGSDGRPGGLETSRGWRDSGTEYLDVVGGAPIPFTNEDGF